jgi:solute carrier family 25 oxoglutarate transporter 11
MLGPFDETKEFLNRYTNTKDTLSTRCYNYLLIRLIASCVGGFLGAFFSLPFDNAKTKIQKMKPDANGVLPYKNIGDCMLKVIDV